MIRVSVWNTCPDVVLTELQWLWISVVVGMVVGVVVVIGGVVVVVAGFVDWCLELNPAGWTILPNTCHRSDPICMCLTCDPDVNVAVLVLVRNSG